MNIQDELQAIHHKYGVSEKANYEIQKLFEKYTKEQTEVNKLALADVSNRRELLVCEHKYQDNVCDWRGVRKCIICGQMEKAIYSC